MLLAKLSFPQGMGTPAKGGYKNILHLLVLRGSPILHDSLSPLKLPELPEELWDDNNVIFQALRQAAVAHTSFD